MKIAVINIYQGQVLRGAERFVEELAKRSAKENQVDVISGDRMPPRRWPLIWRAFLDAQGLSILAFTLKKLPNIWKERFDIVIPLNGGWQPALVRIVTWLYGGKMVIAGQSGMGWDDRNNLWCFPDCFVALSSRAKKWAKKVNPFVKCEYIPNGVDISLFKPEGKAMKLEIKSPVVFCQGALTETKRIDLAIKAVSKIKGVSLLVVGDGEMREKIGEMGSTMLGDRFQLISKIPFNEMPNVYRAADVFTIPSMSYYAFEIVLVEAMACGLGVVANDDPIREEIVGDAGYLVDPTDVNKYAKTLEKALDTNWKRKPIARAEQFGWDKIAKSYEKLFKHLLK